MQVCHILYTVCGFDGEAEVTLQTEHSEQTEELLS